MKTADRKLGYKNLNSAVKTEKLGWLGYCIKNERLQNSSSGTKTRHKRDDQKNLDGHHQTRSEKHGL